jgi:hypothetical protein
MALFLAKCVPDCEKRNEFMDHSPVGPANATGAENVVAIFRTQERRTHI